MGWTLNGKLDPEEALRLLDHFSIESDNDFVMLIENKGAVVEGESSRAYEDGKQRMEIDGCSFMADVVTPPGASKGKVRSNAFVVVRQCDAATASIASLLKSQDSDIKVTVSVFRAGGDSSKEMQPMLEFLLEGARVEVHSILTGGKPRRAREIIFFGYRKIEIRSAPQKTSGQRGAVRSCVFTEA